ncbi:MAG: dTMP kinase [Nitrospiraceae bacterium]
MGVRRGRGRGVFITFEGIEGSGKTTQLAGAAKLLREEGYRVIETREPGGTPFAERIREMLLDSPADSPSAEPIAPECEASLILACRSQHVARVIKPALREGAVVLCDRFSDSTLAYQGYGRGLDLSVLRDLNRFATAGLTPDLTLLFDLPVPVGLGRRRRKETGQNRLDRESPRFHERVRRGFLDLAAQHPRRIRVLDGRPDQETIAMQVRSIVRKFLQRRQRPVTRHHP